MLIFFFGHFLQFKIMFKCGVSEMYNAQLKLCEFVKANIILKF